MQFRKARGIFDMQGAPTILAYRRGSHQAEAFEARSR